MTLSTGTSTSIWCVPKRYSVRWNPQSGIFPVSIAALVLSRPSVFVRAPSTELQYTTAELSIHAQCSPSAGVLPAMYGVQVLRIFTPWLAAKSSRSLWILNTSGLVPSVSQ